MIGEYVDLPKAREIKNLIEMGLINEAVECFDINHIVNKAIEELGELIVALCKGDMENAAEEIADVRIMLEQLEVKLKLNCSPFRRQKMKRLQDIIDREAESVMQP
jgi:phosphoribosyl-ATP pyrophosphohydrolase